MALSTTFTQYTPEIT